MFLQGTAEVVFLHKTDALAAIKRYDNIRLDGKPLKIDFVGANILIPAVVQPTTNGMTGKAKDFFERYAPDLYSNHLSLAFCFISK